MVGAEYGHAARHDHGGVVARGFRGRGRRREHVDCGPRARIERIGDHDPHRAHADRNHAVESGASTRRDVVMRHEGPSEDGDGDHASEHKSAIGEGRVGKL